MKKKEIYPATINPKEKTPFFHNISHEVIQAISAKNTEQAPLYLFTLNNAYVSPFGAVFKNGRVLRESIYQVSNEKIVHNFLSFCKKILQNKVRKIDGDCIVICHSWYQSYYHWTIDIMPRLFLLKDQLSGKSLLVHKNISQFHLDMLNKFNLKKIIFIEDNEIVKSQSVYFTSLPNYCITQSIKINSQESAIFQTNINHSLMREMKQWFQNNNPLLKKNIENKNNKIYISRKKARHRKPLNESELEIMLNKNGFTEVFLEDLSFDQQVQLLNESNVVVGIHGTGLTNILFMEPKTHVINLISELYHDFSPLATAGIADLNYTHINCSGASTNNPAYNDIKVDLNLLQQVLTSISPM